MITAERGSSLSEAAKLRMLAQRGEPLFFARWDRTVFIHYEVEPASLRRQVPFELDLFEGRAFVSLVAFTMQRFRLRLGGALGEWLLRPISDHGFLNVRTYVHHRGETGIYFLAEWLSNRLSVRLGPWSFGLPYRYGKTEYEHDAEGRRELRGGVREGNRQLAYCAAACGEHPAASEPQTLTEFLLERYTAFTQHRGRQRLFRVWHDPWLQTSLELRVERADLLATSGNWWNDAGYLSANYSPGVEVWMGRPHRA